jgi:hypothetical protein
MSWQYDRSELQRRLEEARKKLKDIKDDGNQSRYLFRRMDKKLEIQYLEDCFGILSRVEKMLWSGTMPDYFRCPHWSNQHQVGFDTYDVDTGLNFYALDRKESFTSDRICCHYCSVHIQNLHLQYRAYRHLDFIALLPALIPPLHHIIRSYLVPETS